MKVILRKKLGQDSWRIKNDLVEFWLTQTGGMLGPAEFRLSNGKKVQPFAVAPWAEEAIDPSLPPLLKALRGDFFCAPFGGNGVSYRGEQHPPHGESANSDWRFVDSTRKGGVSEIHLQLETQTRPGIIDKRLSTKKGHRAIYCEQKLSGFSGKLSIGTHPCLRFPEEFGEARVSVGGWEFGQVLPEPFEQAAEGGYCSLKTGARFDDLRSVPMMDGGSADLSRYPAREGFDDLVMLVGRAGRSLGWSAVTFPKERWAFLQFKDPEVLRHTLLWHSNGGRHYAPWSGRHRRVLGVEETTSYFHFGQAESAKANPLSKAGYPTTLSLSKKKPLRVAHIFAVVEIPRGFDVVAEVEATEGGAWVVSESGKRAKLEVDLGFLRV